MKKTAYRLTGRSVYMRNRNTHGLGLRMHILKNGLKDFYDPRDKVLYLVSEATVLAEGLLIPMVSNAGEDKGILKLERHGIINAEKQAV